MIEVEVFGLVEVAGTFQLSGSTPVRTTVLVDSGADTSLLDGTLAQALGINLAQCPQVTSTGVAGTAVFREGLVLMNLCGRWVPIPASFSNGPLGHEQLLGRAGAFDALNLCFGHSQSQLLAAPS